MTLLVMGSWGDVPPLGSPGFGLYTRVYMGSYALSVCVGLSSDAHCPLQAHMYVMMGVPYMLLSMERIEESLAIAWGVLCTGQYEIYTCKLMNILSALSIPLCVTVYMGSYVLSVCVGSVKRCSVSASGSHVCDDGCTVYAFAYGKNGKPCNSTVLCTRQYEISIHVS